MYDAMYKKQEKKRKDENYVLIATAIRRPISPSLIDLITIKLILPQHLIDLIMHPAHPPTQIPPTLNLWRIDLHFFP